MYEKLESYIQLINEGLDNDFYNEIKKFPSNAPFDQTLLRLSKSSILEIRDINNLFLLVETYLKFKKIYSISSIHHSLIKSLKEFRKFVDQNSNIDEMGHPLLKEINLEKRKIDQKAQKILQGKLSTWKQEQILQIDTYDIKNGHYTLALRSDRYRTDLGMIIDKSDSGQTLFVEPFELSEISIQRRKNSYRKTEAMYKIAREYSEVLAKNLNELRVIALETTQADIYFSKAKYSLRKSLNRPLISQGPTIKLNDFFHPLIEDPIKNNCNVTQADKGIVISGPNTGGKTVTLKSLAISILFVHKGLFLPCSQAEIFNYSNLYFLAHDNQDLGLGLSSFSAECKNYLDLINEVNEDSIIFIDEIFNSTSSEEASALALGILKTINEKCNPHIFISTHHKILKLKTHEDASFLSAHMGFDSQSNLPNFKFLVGSPGSSMAIETFKRLSSKASWAQEVLDSSKLILGEQSIMYETLLTELSQSKSQYHKEVLKYKNLNTELENQKQANEGLFRLEKDEMIKKFQEKLKNLENKAHRIIKNIKSGDIISSKSLNKNFDKIKIETPKIKEKKKNIQIEKLRNLPKVDDYVFHIKSNQKAKVLNIKKNIIEILINDKIKTKVQLKDLALSDYKPQKQKFNFSIKKISEAKIRFDARGLRVHQFEDEIEKYFLDLLNEDIPYIEVIHGHGDGMLKSSLQNILKKRREFEVEDQRDGNSGASIIKLKKN